jgi:hypothetical protein
MSQLAFFVLERIEQNWYSKIKIGRGKLGSRESGTTDK